MAGFDEVAKLVNTVGRLPKADQQRILRLVQLLIRAPATTQLRTQHLLRELVASDPDSHARCTALVDELIEDLERTLAPRNAPLRGRDGGYGLPVFGSEQDF